MESVNVELVVLYIQKPLVFEVLFLATTSSFSVFSSSDILLTCWCTVSELRDFNKRIYKPDGSRDVTPSVWETVDAIFSENPPISDGGCEKLLSHPLKNNAGIIPQLT